LGDTDVDGVWNTWGALEDEGTALITEEGGNPGDQVGGDPAFPQDARKRVVFNVNESGLNIQEQGGDLEAWPLLGLNDIGEGEARVVGTKPTERTALVRMQQPLRRGCCEEAGGYDPLEDL